MRFPICDQLFQLKKKGRIPFHMPGHKRKPMLTEICENTDSAPYNISQLDITEITDYDNLHHPEGMIEESMELLREIYGSRKSWYLINGSSVGILSAISAVCEPGDKIMIARNCHKAVYNAIRLLRLEPIYFYPSYNSKYDMFQGIEREQCREIDGILKEHPDIKAFVVTSPTYEGMVSDIAAIKSVTQEYGIPLIVDEAHGAHFIFHEYFPESAVRSGADIVVQSAHKTLPAFTQTALLHLCSDMVKEEAIEEMLSIYETSSPSYLLLASTEYGVLYTQKRRDKVAEYVDKLTDFRSKCAQLSHIRLLEPEDIPGYAYDQGKLVFLLKDASMDGKEFFEHLLERFHVECEMSTAFYVIAMTSVMDEKEDYDALWQAVWTMDQEMEAVPTDDRKSRVTERNGQGSLFSERPHRSKMVWEAIAGEKEYIFLDESSGRIAGEYIYLYPPGIPILVPGEKIEKEIVENLKYYLYNGYNVPNLWSGKIRVLKE